MTAALNAIKKIQPASASDTSLGPGLASGENRLDQEPKKRFQNPSRNSWFRATTKQNAVGMIKTKPLFSQIPPRIVVLTAPKIRKEKNVRIGRLRLDSLRSKLRLETDARGRTVRKVRKGTM